MTVHCRITKIDIEKFQVDLSSRSSDLRNEKGQWGTMHDTYYDHDAEAAFHQNSNNTDKNKNRTSNNSLATGMTQNLMVLVIYVSLLYGDQHFSLLQHTSKES